jgi:hypothetical protein
VSDCTRSASYAVRPRNRCGSKSDQPDEIETLLGLSATATPVQKTPMDGPKSSRRDRRARPCHLRPRRRGEASCVPLSGPSIGAARPNFGRKIAAVAVKIACKITIGGLTMWRLPTARLLPSVIGPCSLDTCPTAGVSRAFARPSHFVHGSFISLNMQH